MENSISHKCIYRYVISKWIWYYGPPGNTNDSDTIEEELGNGWEVFANANPISLFIGDWVLGRRFSNGSCMMREYHVQFCESLWGKFLRATHPVFMFSKEQQAKDFLEDLRLRLAEYKLSVNEDKTAIINFAKGKENIFSFLGFTFFWNKSKGWNKINLVIKTQKEKLGKKTQEFTEWIKLMRSRISRKEIWLITAAKLRGHYNYYGYYCNRGKLLLYYHSVIRDLFKWLNRRSQKKSFTWKQFQGLLSREPLPLPPETTKLKQLGWSPYAK